MLTIGLFGASGFAREVMSWAKTLSFGEPVELVFVSLEGGGAVNGHRNMTEQEFQSLAGEKKFAVAIANAERRVDIIRRVSTYAAPVSLIAPTAFIGDEVSLGENAIICPFVTITANARIGDNFHANIYSYVAHDCVVGDHVTLAPGVKINGHVHVGNRVYMGTGSMIRDGKPGNPTVIGAGAVVGMGAVVLRNVPDGATIVGNPAVSMQR